MVNPPSIQQASAICVRPENRAAIEKAAAELGYRVNSFARGLREGASRTIGVILRSLQNGFHLSVVVEAERRLRDEGSACW